MTSEQREILIGKMIDSPETLTNDDIAMISSDYELRELYEVSSGLADELTPVPEVDIDAEWLKMESLIRAREHRKHFRLRRIGVAAAIAGLLICWAITIKYTQSNNGSAPKTTELYMSEVGSQDSESPILEDTGEIISSTSSEGQQPVKSDVTVPAKSDTYNTDIEEYIRIEQARVDNEVAMALAQIYQEDYDADLEELAEWLDSLPEDSDNIIDSNINRININQLTRI